MSEPGKLILKDKENIILSSKIGKIEVTDRIYMILSNFDTFVLQFLNESSDKNLKRKSKKAFNALYKLYKASIITTNGDERLQRIQFIPRRHKNAKK